MGNAQQNQTLPPAIYQAANQVEYYFGQQNFTTDTYLQNQVAINQGFVPLSAILQFPKMKRILYQQLSDGFGSQLPHIIGTVLQNSTVVEIRNNRVGRRNNRKTTPSAGESKLTDKVKGQTTKQTKTKINTNTGTNTQFAVLTFNILADHLCMTDKHSNVPRHQRDWKNRFPLILKIIMKYRNKLNVSIVCLQEITPRHYSQFQKELSQVGFTSTYCQNESTSFGKYLGNATFVRNDLFSIQYNERQDISYANKLSTLCSSRRTTQRDYYTKNKQVANVLPLIHRATGKRLLVANTHISANYRHPDTQLAQVAVLLKEMERQKQSFAADACIIVGDFNSKPFIEGQQNSRQKGSAVYQFITTGQVPSSHPDCLPSSSSSVETGRKTKRGNKKKNHPNINNIPPLPFLQSNMLKHQLALSSAFKSLNGREPLVTNITGKNGSDWPAFEGCLDYIFYDTNMLSVIKVSELPTDEQMRKENTGGLPNSWCPSDHLPIAAVFRFNNPPASQQFQQSQPKGILKKTGGGGRGGGRGGGKAGGGKAGGGIAHRVHHGSCLKEVHEFDYREPPVVHLSDQRRPLTVLRQYSGNDGHQRIAAAIARVGPFIGQQERQRIFDLLQRVSKAEDMKLITTHQKILLKDLIIGREFHKVEIVLSVFE